MPTDPLSPDPADAPRKRSKYNVDPPGTTWYTAYDFNGRVVYEGPNPIPDSPAPPVSDEPPDEPFVVG